MGSTRIKGRRLMLTIDGTDHWADIVSCFIDNEEKDQEVTTYEDASQPGGARQFYLELTAIQSTDTASFWSTAWDNSGAVVPFIYAPHGNEVPTPAQPHFTGNVQIGPPPRIGGEAGRDVEYTFETRWDCEGKPVKDTGGV